MTFPLPFMMPIKSRPPSIMFSRTAGTNILFNWSFRSSALFDGQTNQSSAEAAASTNNTEAAAGKTYGIPTALERVRVFGSNNAGFTSSTSTGVVTLYGKIGATPSNSLDGVPLGSINTPVGGNESGGRDIFSSDVNTYWDHFWVTITRGSTGTIYLAELQMWGWQ